MNAFKKYIPWVIIAVLVLYSISMYNGLISMEENVDASWSNVETVYQRRMDLIPNLVQTVKGYADFEKSVLTDVIEARSKATSIQLSADNLNPEAMQKFQQAQGQVSSALSRLLVTVERYPNLKANQNFLELQAQLEGTENRISVERRKYNETAKEFNSAIRRFPRVIFASMAGFDKKPYFEASEGAEKVPEVQF